MEQLRGHEIGGLVRRTSISPFQGKYPPPPGLLPQLNNFTVDQKPLWGLCVNVCIHLVLISTSTV